VFDFLKCRYIILTGAQNMVVLEPKNGKTPQPVVPETDKSSFIYI
jgi:hypothetical protein